MLIKNQGQIFKCVTKVESLVAGADWMILDYLTPNKNYPPYYHVMLADSSIYRPIAVLSEEIFDKEVENGNIILGKVKKIRYERFSNKKLNKV